MSWPLSQDYNEAIQSPQRNFTDADLKAGKIVLSPLGLPLPCSGNFADVYQIRCPDGRRWAVKCFTRESPNLRERYAEISKCLSKLRSPFTVDFTWLEQGIRVGGRWYPVLKMQWVEGLTLNQFVAQSVDKPAALDALLQVWTRMGRRLREAGIAHADLQHGNVLLVRDASTNALTLKLIDYDGMYVPALAACPSGEVGHPSYQHPQRMSQGIYSPEVDRFPMLLVATALTALKAKGKSLWEKYDNGDNLLFTEADLNAPTGSALFHELLRSGDAPTAALAESLLQGLRHWVDSVPLLEVIMAEARPVLIAVATPQPVAVNATAVATPTRPASTSTATAVGVTPHRNRSEGTKQTSEIHKKSRRERDYRLGVLLGLCVGGVVVLILLLATALVVVWWAWQPANSPTKQAVPQARHENDVETLALPGGAKLELVLIKPGKFRMGSPEGEVGRFQDEKEHEVEITKPFSLGKYEVTRGQFQCFTKDEGYVTAAERGELASGWNLETGKMERKKEYNWRTVGYPQPDDHPIVCVSWNDAAAFCEWLGRKTGKRVTLPSEAQWEYACRAGSDKRFSFGDDEESLAKFGNVADGTAREKINLNWGMKSHDGYAFSAPVGQYLPNAWGVHDMHGNVGEWCADYYGPYFEGLNHKDPLRSVQHNLSDGRRSRRGGSWQWAPTSSRAAFRGFNKANQCDCDLGFRVCFQSD